MPACSSKPKQPVAAAAGAQEPLFVLERLAHIRTFTLSVCGPPATELIGASARVHGSVV